MRLSISILSVIFLFITSCSNKNYFDNTGVYFCDAENLSANKKKFIHNGVHFGGGEGSTSEEAYQGQYSCRLDSNLQYGLQTIIDNLVPGEIITLSVYRKSSNWNSQGFLTIKSSDNSFYENQKFSFSGKDKNGWERLIFDVQIPNTLDKIKSLMVLVVNNNPTEEVMYFDNLLIERKTLLNKHNITQQDIEYGLEPLKIQLSDVDYEKLFAMRDSAIYQN